jgi:hypothetical protein
MEASITRNLCVSNDHFASSTVVLSVVGFAWVICVGTRIGLGHRERNDVAWLRKAGLGGYNTHVEVRTTPLADNHSNSSGGGNSRGLAKNEIESSDTPCVTVLKIPDVGNARNAFANQVLNGALWQSKRASCDE